MYAIRSYYEVPHRKRRPGAADMDQSGATAGLPVIMVSGRRGAAAAAVRAPSIRRVLLV